MNGLMKHKWLVTGKYSVRTLFRPDNVPPGLCTSQIYSTWKSFRLDFVPPYTKVLKCILMTILLIKTLKIRQQHEVHGKYLSLLRAELRLFCSLTNSSLVRPISKDVERRWGAG